MGSMAAWQAAHSGFLRCASMRWRSGRFATVGPSARGGMAGGGGGGGEHRRRDSTHLPRLTGDVRLGLEVSVSRAAWDRSPKRCVAAPLTATWRIVVPVMPDIR